MLNWIIEDVLKQNVPKLIGALVALGMAHGTWLHSIGIDVNWQTFGGKLTTAAVLLVGMLAGHHTTKAVTAPPAA